MKISKLKLFGAFIGFVVLAAIIIVITVEQFGGGSFTCINDTDLEIVEFDSCIIDDDLFSLHDIYTGPVEKGGKVSVDFDKKIVLENGSEGELMMSVLFEGFEEPLYIFDGYLDRSVKCNLSVRLYKEDGKYYMTAKMGTPLWGNTDDTGVDSTYILDLENMDYDWVE